MIGHLSGKILYNNDKFIILDVNHVGYKVFLNNSISPVKGDELNLWIYTSVRENAIDLYGFIDILDMSFFELLLGVSGIGPKSAMSILDIAPVSMIAFAIEHGDNSYLNKVSGIGKKTAEKIVIELRDKMKPYLIESVNNTILREENDTIEVLKSLGYSLRDAQNVFKEIPNEIEGTNAKVKYALQLLNNK